MAHQNALPRDRDVLGRRRGRERRQGEIPRHAFRGAVCLREWNRLSSGRARGGGAGERNVETARGRAGSVSRGSE